jgi:hypothetical protein
VHPKFSTLISERERAMLILYGVESGYWDEANHWYIGAVAPNGRNTVIGCEDKHQFVFSGTSV